MMSNTRKKIAILGATGHIGKSLTYLMGKSGKYDLVLFSRSTEKTNEFLVNTGLDQGVYAVRNYDAFFKDMYDVVINCVGIGDPKKLKELGSEIFRLTETFDNMVLDYLETHSGALYINFSSGAVYGTDFSEPADENKTLSLDVNNISPSNYYGIAKLNSEAKHRALSQYNIVDIRIFAYFSIFIDLSSRYFITDVIYAVRNKEQLVTNKNNIMRDYIYPDDLFSLIRKCMEQPKLNDVFDAYSLKPISKFEILDYFSREYGLEYVIRKDATILTATGSKDNFYSINKRAEKIGYAPLHTSLDAIIKETSIIFNRPGAFYETH